MTKWRTLFLKTVILTLKIESILPFYLIFWNGTAIEQQKV